MSDVQKSSAFCGIIIRTTRTPKNGKRYQARYRFSSQKSEKKEKKGKFVGGLGLANKLP